jgi:hypothetical protein
MKGTNPMDIISYIFYKGLIFTGLKRWGDAIKEFKLVLQYPSQCSHLVHAESYKKLILLTLMQIADGKIPISAGQTLLSSIVPKDTNANLKYKLESSFQLYTALFNAFINKSKPELF